MTRFIKRTSKSQSDDGAADLYQLDQDKIDEEEQLGEDAARALFDEFSGCLDGCIDLDADCGFYNSY